MIGSTVDQYKVLKSVKKTPLVETYLAKNVTTGEKFLLRAISAKLCSQAEFREKFIADTVKTIELDHPNIVPVTNVLEEGKQLLTVQPFVASRSLAQLIHDNKGKPLADFLWVMKPILEGLHYAHQHGHVHPCLTPAHVLITHKGQVQLIGFGRLLYRVKEKLLPANQLAGDARYFSPERFTNPATTDVRTNLYAAGVILFRLLTGRAPYPTRSYEEAKAAHHDSPIPNPQELNGDVNPVMVSVIAQALAKQPEDRYQTATEFAAALEQARGQAAPEPPPQPTQSSPPKGFSVQTGTPTMGGKRIPTRQDPLLSEDDIFDDAGSTKAGTSTAGGVDDDDMEELRKLREEAARRREAEADQAPPPTKPSAPTIEGDPFAVMEDEPTPSQGVQADDPLFASMSKGTVSAGDDPFAGMESDDDDAADDPFAGMGGDDLDDSDPFAGMGSGDANADDDDPFAGMGDDQAALDNDPFAGMEEKATAVEDDSLAGTDAPDQAQASDDFGSLDDNDDHFASDAPPASDDFGSLDDNDDPFASDAPQASDDFGSLDDNDDPFASDAPQASDDFGSLDDNDDPFADPGAAQSASDFGTEDNEFTFGEDLLNAGQNVAREDAAVDRDDAFSQGDADPFSMDDNDDPFASSMDKAIDEDPFADDNAGGGFDEDFGSMTGDDPFATDLDDMAAEPSAMPASLDDDDDMTFSKSEDDAFSQGGEDPFDFGDDDFGFEDKSAASAHDDIGGDDFSFADEPADGDMDFNAADDLDFGSEPAAKDDDFAFGDESAVKPDDDFGFGDEPAAKDDDFGFDDEPAVKDDDDFGFDDQDSPFDFDADRDSGKADEGNLITGNDSSADGDNPAIESLELDGHMDDSSRDDGLETSDAKQGLADSIDKIDRAEQGSQSKQKSKMTKPVTAKKSRGVDPKILAAAAAFIILLSAAGFFWFRNYQAGKRQAAVNQRIAQFENQKQFDQAIAYISGQLAEGHSASFENVLQQKRAALEDEKSIVEQRAETLMKRATALEEEGQAFVDGQNDALASYLQVLEQKPNHTAAQAAAERIKAAQIARVDDLLAEGKDLEALNILQGLVSADRSDSEIRQRSQRLRASLEKERTADLEAQLNRLYMDQKFLEAVPLYQELVTINPRAELVGKMKDELFSALKSMGDEAYARGDFDAAEKAYKGALTIQPKHPQLATAMDQLSVERRQATIEELSLKLDRATAQANYQAMFDYATRLKRLDPANTMASHALEKVSLEVSRLRKLANDQKGLGQYKKAADTYKIIYDIQGDPMDQAKWERFSAWKPPSGMTFIPVGAFRMGDNGYRDASPVHDVIVANFFIDIYEVTNRQFKAFVDANPAWHPSRIDPRLHDGNYLKHWQAGSPPPNSLDQPVTYISWYAAKAYAEFVGKRLPTEAEWEKAARGGTTDKAFWWGNYPDAEQAVYEFYPKKQPAKVGSFPPNQYGIYEILGNVNEWVEDTYSMDFYKRTQGATDPVNTQAGDNKVFRGGSFRSRGRELAVFLRGNASPRLCNPTIGFRCAQDAAQP